MSKVNAHTRFGTALHKVIKQFVSMEQDLIIANFVEQWDRYKEEDLHYIEGESWEFLRDCGATLVNLFPESYRGQDLTPILYENKLIYAGQRKTAQPDFIASRPDKNVVIVDYKFGREWTRDQVDNDEQLTEYAVAVEETFFEEPPITVCICNLVSATRQVNWIYSVRSREQIDEYNNREADFFPAI